MSFSKYSNEQYSRSRGSSQGEKVEIRKRINLEEVLKEAEREAKKDSKVMEPDDIDFWDLVQEAFRKQANNSKADLQEEELETTGRGSKKKLKISTSSFPKGTKLSVREHGRDPESNELVDMQQAKKLANSRALLSHQPATAKTFMAAMRN